MGVKGRLQVLAYLERSMKLHDTAMVQGPVWDGLRLLVATLAWQGHK